MRKTLFVISVVMVVVAAVGFWLLIQPAEPVKFSIDQSVIKHGENATITVMAENVDMITCNVEYRFHVSDRIKIYEGAERLLPRIGQEYVFNYTIEASIPSEERVFVAIGTLEKGIRSAEYPISLNVYYGGRELEETWSDLILKVER